VIRVPASTPPAARAAALLAAVPAALLAALLAAAPALAAEPAVPPDQLRFVPPARMGGFVLRALWETRYARQVGDRRRGEVWKVEAAYDFDPAAPPRDGAGRPLPDPARPGCPVRHDHGMPVNLQVIRTGEAGRPCGTDGESIRLGEGCGTLRRNVGDKAQTEGAWAVDWSEGGLESLLRIGPAAAGLPDAAARLVEAAAQARAWAVQLRPGASPDLSRLGPQRAASEAALAAGKAELDAPAACR